MEQFAIGKTRLMVIGCGGCGCNTVNRLADEKIEGVELVAANTDLQALNAVNTPIKIPLGKELTRGLGAGGHSSIGEKAAEEASEKLKSVLTGMNMVFITAGMGGGTGTGAAPVVARIAREAGCLTVAIVTTPFRYEGKRIKAIAEEGLKKLYTHADKVIEISNENLFEIVGKEKEVEIAFRFADEILKNSVIGITRIITQQGLINVDFADVKAVMEVEGKAIMGIGGGNGEGRAIQAVKNMLDHPLMGKFEIKGAKGVLAMVSYNKKLEGGEFEAIGDFLHSLSSENAHFKIGQSFEENMNDEISITLIIIGFNNPGEKPFDVRAGLEELSDKTIHKKEWNSLKKELGMGTSVPPPPPSPTDRNPLGKYPEDILSPTWKRKGGDYKNGDY